MKFYRFLIIILAVFKAGFSWATHLRAGEITAERISNTSLTYRVTLTTYTDEINGRSANEVQEDVNFFPGFISNGVVSYKVPRKEKIQISPSTVRNTYETVVTFPGPGIYKVSCGIPNRNEATINLPQPSDAITFFVQTTLVINAAFGLNSTPVLLNIPIDSAALGVRFIHNPGAFDIDGDSLSYKLTIPFEDRLEANGIGGPILGYKDPSTLGDSPILNEDGTAPATFRINPRTGDLIWDAPQKIGQYNVAFIIEEWRKAPDGSYVRIGEIVRDMQIIVVDTENDRPELEVPDDLCVEAGELLKFEVTGTDENTDQRLTLSSSGGIYNKDAGGFFQRFISDKAATFKVTKTGTSPVKGEFEWETNCDHVREQPYDVLFKLDDNPGRFETQLTDLKTVNVKVIPGRPKGLTGVENDNGVALTWQKYQTCTNAGTIHIYRKEGCSGLNPAQCQLGIPEEWKYTEIGVVDLNDSTFTDPTAQKGQIYSYRLVVELEVSIFNSLWSAPSTEFCIGSDLPKNVPVITKVSVERTSEDTGEVLVTWSKPIGLDTSIFKGPYSYKLYRTEGLGGDNFAEIAEIPTTFSNGQDTVFTDKNINTKNTTYKYKLAFFYEGTKLMGEAPSATTVRLNGKPDDSKVDLSWEMNTPWVNEDREHIVYRADLNNPEVFHIIAKVQVGGPSSYTFTDTGTDSFLDDGDQTISIQNDIEYCYKVETVGAYVNEAIIFGDLHNVSQEICVKPADRTPPCAVVLSLQNPDCESLSQEDFCEINAFTNKLAWQADNTQQCRSQADHYNVFYSRFKDGTFQQIANLESTFFDHRKNNQEGFAGCYYVTAVSVLDIESEPSNIVCADNCSKISFPNVFSPNNDGRNDTFEPMNCPAFIKSIDYEVYNRSGLLVAQGSGQNMAWDGVGTNGKLLSVGTYFYQIKVQFNRLEENSDVFTYKGYVDLIK